jgi:uncharacterized protein (TIGR03435 family)
MRTKALLLLTTLACIPAISISSAQTASTAATVSAQATPPAYDVMTIKPNVTGNGSTAFSLDTKGDHFVAHHVSLKQILQYVYDLNEDSIAGVPAQFDTLRFDIEAKVVEPDQDTLKKMNSEQRRAMLRPLVTERFQLKTHTEFRILPVYELVVAKGGPKCKLSDDQTKLGWGDIGLYYNKSDIRLEGRGIPMVHLAQNLADQVRRTVIDKTRLTGNYRLTLQWTPDDRPASTDDNAPPSIYTAVQEQLGLKLQPAKGPVEVLVIDHAAMPSEN